MNKIPPPRFTWPLFGLAFSLLFPSLGEVQKYLGNRGVAVYVIIASTVLVIGYRYILPWFVSKVTERQALGLSVMTLLFLIVVFAAIYPIANSGIVGRGSDSDEGFNIAVMELLHGRNPYHIRTYLGNPLVQMPGSVLLTAPFVLLGNSAYQNFFWLAAFFLLVKVYLEDWRFTFLLMWAVLALCPTVLQQVVVGSDYAANGVYILVFIWLLVNCAPRRDISIWKKIIAAVLLGIGLSCRGNFLWLLPLVFSQLVQNPGWKPAFGYTVLTLLAFCAVTFPFYFFDPQAFVPFSVQYDRLAQFQEILPFAGIVIPSIGIMITFALSLQRMGKDCRVLFRNCAVVQGFFVLCGVVLSSIQAGKPYFGWTSYGLFFLFFGALTSSAKLVEVIKEKRFPASI